MNPLFDAVRRAFRRDRELADCPAPGFDPHGRLGDVQAGEIVRLRMRRPIVAGMVVVLVLVLGLFLWAAFASVTGAVQAAGAVRVEGNTKQIKHREGGIVRRILVREGQRVAAGQVLMRFDQVQAAAGVDILRSTYDSALAQQARFQAEATDASDIRFPAELTARAGDPRVGLVMAGERALFLARMTLYRSQAQVLGGQARQLETQISGLRAQVASADAQSALIGEELSGLKELNTLGYAPKSRLLALQRGAAGLSGQRGSVVSDIGRARQAIGDLRIQLAQLDEKRQTEAADGMRQVQDKLTETGPKLRTIQESLDQTTVRAPVAGFVFGLTQFTEGGVAQPGETLMEIVPSGQPLIITARIKPSDITDVRVGMPARVSLSGYNPRTTPPVEGRVSLVAADAAADPATHDSFYIVQVKVDPGALAAAGPDVHMTPGMPATVAIVTGSRTILDFLLSPFTDAMRTAFRER